MNKLHLNKKILIFGLIFLSLNFVLIVIWKNKINKSKTSTQINLPKINEVKIGPNSVSSNFGKDIKLGEVVSITNASTQTQKFTINAQASKQHLLPIGAILSQKFDKMGSVEIIFEASVSAPISFQVKP